ncbi:hypothetical protein Tco_0921109 [Tanacetum coccineum]
MIPISRKWILFLEDWLIINSSDDNLVDPISRCSTDEHALDYLSPPLWDDYDDELFDLETVNDNTYDDPFDSGEEKIKESKLLIDDLIFLDQVIAFIPLRECDSVVYEDFLEDNDLAFDQQRGTRIVEAIPCSRFCPSLQVLPLLSLHVRSQYQIL